MINFDPKKFAISLIIKKQTIDTFISLFEKYFLLILLFILSVLAITSYWRYLDNGYALAYNDARSHLDIGRRVVENLKPGFAQLGSVWLPLPHFLMLATIWNDFFWHTGLAGTLQSMIAYVATGCLIYLFLRKLKVGWFGIIAGIAVFALNPNILYLQSTAMTELLLLATMTAGVYDLLMWIEDFSLYRLIRSAFWIMLSTLVRYDGWFLLVYATMLVFILVLLKSGYKKAEGTVITFATLGAFGVFIWLLWNQIIFKDIFYFISGPYSAATQQNQLEAAGVLPTKHNLNFSTVTYIFAMIYNSSFLSVIVAFIGSIFLFLDKNLSRDIKIVATSLLSPLLFNILALYMGQSVLFVQNLNGSWFNVRYGLMMIPTIAIFVGVFVHKTPKLRLIFIGLFILITFFSNINHEIVTLDDALIGASGKNVKQVSGWLKFNASQKTGFVLISVASHDAIIFSSGMPMSRFIHEGTGEYWDLAIKHPSLWARWIIMRTRDDNDATYKEIKGNVEFKDYTLIYKYPFADIYELKPQFLKNLHTKPVNFAKQ